MNILFLVAAGGAIGAVARYLLTMLTFSSKFAQFPFATLVVNTLGSFIIGACYVWVFERSSMGEPFRAFMMVGVLGGFTTYSAFSLETLRFIEQGQLSQAIVYVLATLILALIAVFAGVSLVRLF